MKKIVSIVALCMVAQAAVAAPAGRGGRNQMMASPRGGGAGQMMGARSGMANTGNMAAGGERVAGVAASQQITAGTAGTGTPMLENKSSLKVDNNTADGITADVAIVPEEMISAEKQKDMREKERNACISNNIGVGNTFVWASRFSNVNNYSSMVEDVENPENNVCFVKVEMKSTDSKISVADIPAKYFEMGRTITCGSWADEETLRKRILDAKKSARTWGTVAGAVGGAAVGVGAMELFGNKLIGGAVEGQKSLKGDELIRSQLAVLEKDNPSEYAKFMTNLRVLSAECSKSIWTADAKAKDTEVSTICDKYDGLFSMIQ